MNEAMTSIPIIPKTKIAACCRRHHIHRLDLFGAVLRDDFGPDSDVDVLVTFEDQARWSLYDWVDMIDELELLFHLKVDLVDKEGLRNPFRRHNILNSRMVIYAA